MNKKTKTMFVFQPGGFGTSVVAFSTYEYPNSSSIEDAGWPKRRRSEMVSVSCAGASAVAKQTLDNQNWIRAVVRFPDTLRRTVWSPLARRIQKPVRAA